MKKILAIIAVIMLLGILWISYHHDSDETYVGTESSAYRLSTEDIYMEAYDFNFSGSVGSDFHVVENEEELEKLADVFTNVKELPGFEELLDEYPLDDHVYFFVCWYHDNSKVTPLGLIIDPDNDAVYTDCEYHSERRGLFWTDSEPAVVYPKVILAIAGKEQIEGVDLGKYKDYCDET